MDLVRVVTKWRWLDVCIACDHVFEDLIVEKKDRDWFFFSRLDEANP
jgi:hypothetical protein